MRRCVVILHYFKISFSRASAELKAEASVGFLGLLWWIIEPVLYMGVFYLLFSVMRIRGDGDFVPFLLVGLVVWRWFANAVVQGANSMEKSANLIQQIYLPKFIFPLVALMVNLFKFFIVMSLLLFFLYLYGVELSLQWMLLPVVVFVQFLFVTGVVFIMAAIVPFLPDLKVLISNGLTLMFFLSGVFFDISKAPEHFQVYLNMNPMILLIDSYRVILLEGVLPNWSGLMIISACSVLLVCLGWFIMARFDRQYPKILVR